MEAIRVKLIYKIIFRSDITQPLLAPPIADVVAQESLIAIAVSVIVTLLVLILVFIYCCKSGRCCCAKKESKLKPNDIER